MEAQARRAKAEARAEAHAEFADRLRGAELLVMQAQRTVRKAEEERAKAEALLAQAQQELARRRRDVERDGRGTPRTGPADSQRDRQEADEFSDVLARAEAQLGAVREELRQLVVTTNRVAFRSDAGLWGVLLFTSGTALAGAVVVIFGTPLARKAATVMLDRDSEAGAGVPAFLLSIAASAVFLVAAFFTPLSWPGPAGAWGRGLATAVGLG
ncbi:hypothetical protein ACIRBY_18110 [Streptomyces sp. NPDC096136]|uniref:hypothetical protein n=1 Tax=Streptomyces sp. NPDC096136 TaxID=3366076 RepID=UPI0037FFC71C